MGTPDVSVNAITHVTKPIQLTNKDSCILHTYTQIQSTLAESLDRGNTVTVRQCINATAIVQLQAISLSFKMRVKLEFFAIL